MWGGGGGGNFLTGLQEKGGGGGGGGGGIIFQLACKKCEDGRTCFRCRISKCEQNDENYSYLDNFIDR